MKRATMYRAIIIVLILLHPFIAYSVRTLPKNPVVHSVDIEFNGETLKGYFLIIDSRTNEEKSLHLKNKSIDGTVIVFFQGHAQRPDDVSTFTSKLALESKSGIVIVPVCDTPFGKKEELHGDKGKIVILMEMIRYALSFCSMDVKNYSLHDMPVTINNKTIPIDESTTKVQISAVGWSHGAILARMMAGTYDSIKNLVQICPAGFKPWSKNQCVASCCVLSSFNWESIRISTEIFKGNGKAVFSAGWGITKGITGDTIRSCNSCIYGNFNILKVFRPYKDIADVTRSERYPVKNLSNIVVIFGEDDSLFDPRDIVGKHYTSPEITDLFFKTFYPEAVGISKLHLFILPGKHIAPAIFYTEYALHTLHYIDEYNN